MDKFPNKNGRKPLSLNTTGYNNNNTTRKKKNYSSSGTSSNSFQQTFPTHQPFAGANDSLGQTHHNTSLNLNSNSFGQNMLEHNKNILLKVDSSGNKPSSRFGHSITLINPVKTVLFGGAVGDIRNFHFANDTYVFNLMTRIWVQINFPDKTQLPKERAAHAAAANDNMQMVIHGGSIGNNSLAADELWLFDMHDNKEEESKWIPIKTVGPSPGMRYGHTLAFLKPFFIMFGGNTNSNDVWIIDINAVQVSWIKLDLPNGTGPCPRLYHTVGFCSKGGAQGMMIVFGGRDSTDNPLNDIWGLRRHRDGRWDWILATISKGDKLKPRYNHSVVFYGTLMIILGGRARNFYGTMPTEVYDTEKAESFIFPGIGLHRQSSFILDKNIYLYGGFSDKNNSKPIDDLSKLSLESLFEGTPLFTKVNEYNGKSLPHATKINQNNREQRQTSKFKLSYDVVVGAGGTQMNEDDIEDTSTLFRKVSLDKLQEENKRIGERQGNILVQSRRVYNFDLINHFIDNLLRPFDWYDQEKMDKLHEELPFTDDQIFALLKEVKPIMEKERSLIKIRAPCKVFGNLYGEYNDLMRFFESFGNPSDDNQMGDISVMQYIFLGDFCDRGYYSLEIVLLLFALKVKYPEYIHILRGHHEDINVNTYYGLGQECKDRLSDNLLNPDGIFAQINNIFDLLPFAVLIEDSILCVHGGIGSRLATLADIENIRRPAKIVQEVSNPQQQILIDLLWSEYADDINDLDVNLERDKKKYGFIVKYGKDRLNKFLSDNKLQMLITSHQFIPEGFMSFNDGSLLTVFSATNYMDKCGNVGGMLYIAKKVRDKPMCIIPKLINVYESKKEYYRKDKSPSPIRTNKK